MQGWHYVASWEARHPRGRSDLCWLILTLPGSYPTSRLCCISQQELSEIAAWLALVLDEAGSPPPPQHFCRLLGCEGVGNGVKLTSEASFSWWRELHPQLIVLC